MCGHGVLEVDCWWMYECRYASVLEWGSLNWELCPLERRLRGSSRPAAGFTSTKPFMVLYILQTLFDVLLDCNFFRRSCFTTAEGLKSRRMRRADCRCTISSVDLRCCWWGSHTTDAHSRTDYIRPWLQSVWTAVGHPLRFLYVKAFTLSVFAAADWICLPERKFSVNSTPRYFELLSSQGFSCGGSSWWRSCPFSRWQSIGDICLR